MKKTKTVAESRVTTVQVLPLAALAFAALALSVSAKPTYIHDDAHGLVRFTVKLAGLSDVEGRFTETDAAITYKFDPFDANAFENLRHIAQ